MFQRDPRTNLAGNIRLQQFSSNIPRDMLLDMPWTRRAAGEETVRVNSDLKQPKPQQTNDLDTSNMPYVSHLSAFSWLILRASRFNGRRDHAVHPTWVWKIQQFGRVMAVTRETSRFSGGPKTEPFENIRRIRSRTPLSRGRSPWSVGSFRRGRFVRSSLESSRPSRWLASWCDCTDQTKHYTSKQILQHCLCVGISGGLNQYASQILDLEQFVAEEAERIPPCGEDSSYNYQVIKESRP